MLGVLFNLSYEYGKAVEHFKEVDPTPSRERGFVIDNLLVRINLTIEMKLVDRPSAMGV